MHNRFAALNPHGTLDFSLPSEGAISEYVGEFCAIWCLDPSRIGRVCFSPHCIMLISPHSSTHNSDMITVCDAICQWRHASGCTEIESLRIIGPLRILVGPKLCILHSSRNICTKRRPREDWSGCRAFTEIGSNCTYLTEIGCVFHVP